MFIRIHQLYCTQATYTWFLMIMIYIHSKMPIMPLTWGRTNLSFSPGAFAKKNRESYMDAHLIPWGKVKTNPSRGISYSRWPPSPLVAYGYTIYHVFFFNICYRKTILACIPMLWKSANTVKWYSYISLDPAGENPIWLPLQSNYH